MGNVFIESFIRAVLLSRYVASYLRLLRIYIFMGGPKLARGDRFWRRTDFFVTGLSICATDSATTSRHYRIAQFLAGKNFGESPLLEYLAGKKLADA